CHAGGRRIPGGSRAASRGRGQPFAGRGAGPDRRRTRGPDERARPQGARGGITMDQELCGRVQEVIDGFGIKEVLQACAVCCEEEARCGAPPGLESLAREWEHAAALLRRAAGELAL